MYFLYILYSNNYHRSYVGVTKNLEKRLKQHNNGECKSSRAWRPLMLIYHEEYKTLSEARKREWFLKCTPQGGKLKQIIIKEFLNGRDVPKPKGRDGGLAMT